MGFDCIMKVALLITTYNSPEALRVVLESVYNQTVLPDQLIVADDGSNDSTRSLVNSITEHWSMEVKYVWQEDKGFRLSKIRNYAIATTDADYIIMIDGDVILHRDFVLDHLSQSRPGYFLCGIRALISEKRSKEYKEGIINSSPTFFSKGIQKRLWGVRSTFFSNFFIGHHQNSTRQILGCNMSFWRKDIVAVNGFNEDFEGWGCEDRECAVRLFNYGLKRRTLIFRAIQFHLFHKTRVVKDTHMRNRRILAETKSSGIIKCKNGIEKF